MSQLANDDARAGDICFDTSCARSARDVPRFQVLAGSQQQARRRGGVGRDVTRGGANGRGGSQFQPRVGRRAKWPAPRRCLLCCAPSLP